MALSCAAADDITAWCLLAVVVAMTQSHAGDSVQMIAGTAIYIAAMLLIVRWVTHRLARQLEGAPLPTWAIPATLVTVMLSALVTKTIGLHSAIGGFLLGAVMPHRGRLAEELHRKLHDVATILLLPAFFAITGLHTQINLLNRGSDWLIAGVVILVATAGKVGGTVAAARLSGMAWREASALGMLMNTRGLMELIVLNIGLDMGIISPTLYSIMVLMALATTLMTAPAVQWLLGSTHTKPD
jgi:Kef-type K+ transport system membrane component KefB